MRTLIAYRWDDPSGSAASAAVDRLERWYAQLWPEGWRRQEKHRADRGLCMWDVPDPSCAWPWWAADGDEAAATLHVPLGYEQVVGDVTPAVALLPLARRVAREPADVLHIAAPFALAHLAPTGTMTLLADALGVGRIFEIETAAGTVWSNRPLAACLFAGVTPRASADGWRYYAGCDWTMDDSTPYEGVRALGIGEWVSVAESGSLTRHTLPVLERLAAAHGHDPLSPDNLDRVAASLQAAAATTAQLWTVPARLGLSGGRDSRLVAAAFISAGVDLNVATNAVIQGEADTARALMAALPNPPLHKVGKPVTAGSRPRRKGAVERARAWHDRYEGLESALYAHARPPRLAEIGNLQVTGCGGEVAHGHYYPHDAAAIEKRSREQRVDEWTAVLLARLLLPRGLAEPTRMAVEARVRVVLEEAESAGIATAASLDWFYIAERLRRWGNIGQRSNKLAPLLTGAFVEASLALSPVQRAESALHRELIARMVPAWRDIPFFRATLSQRTVAKRVHLWEEPDADLVSAIIMDPSAWSADYEVPVVQRVWRRGVNSGAMGMRDEQLVQRVLWRAAFEDHLSGVGGQPPPQRQPVILARSTAVAPRAAVGVARRVAVWANDVPLARKLARTKTGGRLRRMLGV